MAAFESVHVVDLKRLPRHIGRALGSTLNDFPGAPRICGLKLGYRF